MDRLLKRDVHRSNKDAAELEQLKYTLLRLFVKVISSATRPVIMHLDDLHWIDPGTMIVLESMLNAPELLKNMVFTGPYRDNEITDDHMLRRWMQSRSDSPIHITTRNLQVEHVNNLLAESLKVDDVAELADLMYNRTNGNAFHMLQLLDYMQDEELLEFSNVQFCWGWDIANIRDQTVLSDNLVDIVEVKLKRLPSEIQTCISLCSCLGFRIDEEILYSIKNVIPDHQVLDLAGALETAMAEGVLERLREKRLKFAHDKIYQAALQLIPNEKDQQRLYYTVGQGLYQTYGLEVKDQLDDARDRVVFLCAHMLNLGSTSELSKTDGFRNKLSELNYQAGKRAVDASTFLPSLDHLQAGIDLLDSDRCWLDQYDLILKLYTLIAEMCYCTGQIDRHKLAVDQVLQNAKSINC